MYRGTTPTITFNIKTDIDLSDLAVCWVTFKSKVGFGEQREKTYDLNNLIIDPVKKTIEVAMSQDDTLMFMPGTVNVQIRLRTNEDLAYASDIKDIRMNDILRGGRI